MSNLTMGRTADERDYRPRLGAGLKRAVFALAIVVAACAAGLASPVPSSARDAGVQLPLGSPRSLVLDEAHSHVILTGDPMVVTDYAGEIVATLDDEGGASGMVLDDGLLYVARCSASRIDIIDTATLARVESIPISIGIGTTNQGRCELAEAGGQLWFDTTSDVGPLGSMAVAAPHTLVTHTGIDVDNSLFATTATNPNLLVIASSKYCPSAVQVYDMSAATPNLLRSTTAAYACMRSIQFTADGRRPPDRERRRREASAVGSGPDVGHAGRELHHGVRPVGRRLVPVGRLGSDTVGVRFPRRCYDVISSAQLGDQLRRRLGRHGHDSGWLSPVCAGGKLPRGARRACTDPPHADLAVVALGDSGRRRQ